MFEHPISTFDVDWQPEILSPIARLPDILEDCAITETAEQSRGRVSINSFMTSSYLLKFVYLYFQYFSGRIWVSFTVLVYFFVVFC